MRIVPRRGSDESFSGGGGTGNSFEVLVSLVDGLGRRLNGSGRWPALTEAARPVMTGLRWMGLLSAEPAGSGLDRSASGGGVGGNIFLLTGGSDCWREREAMPGLTRLDAANEMPSGGRSSRPLEAGTT